MKFVSWELGRAGRNQVQVVLFQGLYKRRVPALVTKPPQCPALKWDLQAQPFVSFPWASLATFFTFLDASSLSLKPTLIPVLHERSGRVLRGPWS